MTPSNIRVIITITLSLLLSAQAAQRLSAQVKIDTTTVQPMSWKEAQIQRKYEWYITRQARMVADSIVHYQMPSGGWCKNQDWGLGPDTAYMHECMTTGIGSTIDNGATTQELTFLAKMYYYTNIIDYRIAFLKGLDYLLRMQYENGGWPQYYPTRGEGHYSNHITFNDNAMIHVMRFLHEVADDVEPYDMLFLRKEQKDQCRAAYEKGIQCILKCQIRTENGLTVWCQQHDENTLKPAQGRIYELPSFCGTIETCEIINELLAQPNPSEDIILAIDGAIRWLENHKITGLRLVKFTDAEGQKDARLEEDSQAPALWARMYDLINGEPIFCGRDGIPRKKLSEIDQERRTGYQWYSTKPQQLIDCHAAWEEQILGNYLY